MSRRRVVPSLLTLLFVAAVPGLRADDEPEFKGKALSYWIKQINEGPSPQDRIRGVLAVEQIGYWSSKDKALPALIRAMRQDKEPKVRAAGARALGRAIVRAFEIAVEDGKDKPKLDKQRDELAAVLKTDKADAVREAAAWALGDLGPDARGSVGTLAGALKDKHAGTVRAAASALRKVGKDAREAEPDLVKLLADARADVVARTEAARCVGFTRVDPAGMLAALKEVAADGKADAGLRRVVCETIGKLGKDGVEASAVLGAVLAEGVPARATDAEKAARAALRLAAASALDEFGSSAKAALPQLIKAVADEDRFVRCKALHSLGQMGLSLDRHRGDAWKAIKAATDDTNTEVAVAALDAIGSLASEGLGARVDDALKHLDALLEREGRKAIVEAAKAAREKLRPKKK